MMTPLIIITSIMFMAPAISISTNHHHLLQILLNMEIMSLLILMMITFHMMFSSMEFINLMYLLAGAACEASMGLSCLIMMNRTKSNDNTLSLNSVKC